MPRHSFPAAPTNLLTNLKLQNFTFYSIIQLFEGANVIYLVLDQDPGSAIVAVEVEVWAFLRCQMGS